MKTRSLLKKLGDKFPKKTAEWYDHPGLQVGSFKEETTKILLCLDFDDEVLPTVLDYKPDMIITHHPFIFGKLKQVLASDPVKAVLYEKMKELDIPIMSYHTNFDLGKDGMNDTLANLLNLEDIKPLETCPMARGGHLKEPMEIHDFAKIAKKAFGVDYGLLIAEGKKMVQSVAIIGGGGSREYVNAMNEGYDIYISGDAPHHCRREIVLNHYNYIDFPHEIEHVFMTQMEEILLGLDPNLQIKKVDHEKLPEVI